MNALRKFSSSKNFFLKKDDLPTNSTEIQRPKGKFSPSKRNILKRGKSDSSSSKMKRGGKFTFRKKKLSKSFPSLDDSLASEVESVDQTLSFTTEDNGSLVSCESPTRKKLEEVTDENPTPNQQRNNLTELPETLEEEENENTKKQELLLNDKKDVPEELRWLLQDNLKIRKEELSSVVEESFLPDRLKVEPSAEKFTGKQEEESSATKEDLFEETKETEIPQSNVKQQRQEHAFTTKKDNPSKPKVECCNNSTKENEEPYFAEEKETTNHNEPDCFFFDCFILPLFKVQQQPILR